MWMPPRDHAFVRRNASPARTTPRWRIVALAAVVAATGSSTSRGVEPPATDPASPQVCADLPEAAALLAELNAPRAAGADCGEAGRFDAAVPLLWEPRLAQIADRQAAAVAQRRALSHGIDGADLGSRLQSVTYLQAHAAENLAVGPITLAETVSRWVASAPHCANLMAPYLRDVGVGCAVGVDAGGAPRRYWAVVLGQPRPTIGVVQTVSTAR